MALINKYFTILLFILSIVFFTKCAITTRQYISIENKFNDNKTDTVFYKNILIINKPDKSVDIVKYKSEKRNGKTVCISKTINGEIAEYNVCRYKNGKMEGWFKIYSEKGKLLRKVKMKNGKPMSIITR